MKDPYEIVYTLFNEEKYGEIREGKRAFEERLERKRHAISILGREK